MCVDWPKTLKGKGKYPSRSACSKMLWNLDFADFPLQIRVGEACEKTRVHHYKQQ